MPLNLFVYNIVNLSMYEKNGVIKSYIIVVNSYILEKNYIN